MTSPHTGKNTSAAGRVALVCALWALVHSALASKRAKGFACEVLGARRRNGLYRLAYNAQSTLSVAWAAWWFLGLPDREIYQARPPLSWLLRLAQVASLAVLFSGVRAYGVLDFAGLTRLRGFFAGLDPDPEPEAQGPILDADGRMRATGTFRFTRHPGNLGGLGFFLFFPRMTENRAVLATAATVYVVLGSLHEERRLRAAYGGAYERYRRSVPFLVPRAPRR